MKKSLRLISVFILLTVLVPFVITGNANNEEYTLYCNDSKFEFTEYPAMVINGKLHVPSSMFIGFKNILYEYSKKHDSFYFMNRDTGRYIAFSFNTKNIIVDGEYTDISFPIVNSTIYVPIDYCASVLSLTTDYKKTDDTVHLRLCNGSETLDFNELINLFSPKEPDEPKLPDPPPAEIVPDVPDEPDEPIPPTPVTPPPEEKPQDKEAKNIYLLIEFSEGGSVKDTIDYLNFAGINATLFFSNSALVAEPLEVFHAITSSYPIGLTADSESEAYAEEIKDANNTLAHISNFSSRLYLSNHGAPVIGEGYVPCIPVIDTKNYSHLSVMDGAKKIYSDATALKNVTIKFTAEKDNSTLLVALVGFLAGDELVEFKVIDT